MDETQVNLENSNVETNKPLLAGKFVDKDANIKGIISMNKTTLTEQSLQNMSEAAVESLYLELSENAYKNSLKYSIEKSYNKFLSILKQNK